MHEAVFKLADGIPLPPRMKDHPLKGDWSGYRDCHLAPDWLLLYQIDDDLLTLAATGTHADLFD
jgi:mRNA interferase YafQ